MSSNPSDWPHSHSPCAALLSVLSAPPGGPGLEMSGGPGITRDSQCPIYVHELLQSTGCADVGVPVNYGEQRNSQNGLQEQGDQDHVTKPLWEKLWKTGWLLGAAAGGRCWGLLPLPQGSDSAECTLHLAPLWRSGLVDHKVYPESWLLNPAQSRVGRIPKTFSAWESVFLVFFPFLSLNNMFVELKLCASFMCLGLHPALTAPQGFSSSRSLEECCDFRPHTCACNPTPTLHPRARTTGLCAHTLRWGQACPAWL